MGVNPNKVPNNFINKLTHRPQISDENISNEGINNSNTLLRTNSHSTTPLDKNNQYVHKEYNNNKKTNVSSRTGCTTSSQPIPRTNSTQSPNTQSLCTNKVCTWSNKTASNNKNNNTNNTDELRIYHQNIRGLNNNKINELETHLPPLFPQILCITKHHLRDFEIGNISINHYNLGAFYCRKSCKHGGVKTLVHDTLTHTNIDLSKYCNDHDLEACAIKLKILTTTYCILCIYS